MSSGTFPLTVPYSSEVLHLSISIFCIFKHPLCYSSEANILRLTPIHWLDNLSYFAEIQMENWINKLTSKDNTISYCFTLFTCGGPCRLSSFKQCSGDLIFLWELLVYSLEFVLLPHWYKGVWIPSPETPWCPLNALSLPRMSQLRWRWRVSAFIFWVTLHLYVPPVYAETRHYYHHARAQKYQQK